MNKRNKGVRVAALVCVALLLFMYLATLIAAFTSVGGRNVSGA